MPSVTLIDNYDSFTFNLVHYFGALGAQVKVLRNDQASVEEIIGEEPDCLVQVLLILVPVAIHWRRAIVLTQGSPGWTAPVTVRPLRPAGRRGSGGLVVRRAPAAQKVIRLRQLEARLRLRRWSCRHRL